MGEIADDMVSGRCCEVCGTYFVKEHGHPVVCKYCYRQLSYNDKKRTQLATYPEI